MDRKDFVSPHRKKIRRSITIQNFRTESGINSYNVPWTSNEVQHLLKRVLFGSTKADIKYFKSKTVSQAVDELLNPTAALPSPPVNDYNSSTVTDPNVP